MINWEITPPFMCKSQGDFIMRRYTRQELKIMLHRVVAIDIECPSGGKWQRKKDILDGLIGDINTLLEIGD